MVAPLVAAGLIAGGASIAGGILGSNSAAAQNREEREWQEMMAGSQYQRAVADMRAAGLNPAMLYGKGPLSSPVQSGPRMEEGRAKSEGVRQAGAMASQAMLMQAQINDVNSGARLKDVQASAVEQDKTIQWNDWMGKNPGGDMTAYGRLQRERVEQEIAESLSRVKGIEASAAEAQARKALIEIQARMAKYGESEAQAWKKYWDTVGVGGAYLSVGGTAFKAFSSLLPGLRIGKGYNSPGRIDGGASGAGSLNRRTRYFSED